MVRNYFYDNDHAVVVKDQASATIINNTVVDVHTLPGTTAATASAFNLREAGVGAPGRRVVAVGNVLRDVAAVFENPGPYGPDPVPVTFAGNFAPDGTAYPPGALFDFGGGNKTSDPLLTAETNVLDPAAAFVLLPGSPAKGAGPNGVDAGAVIKTGLIPKPNPGGTVWET